MLSQDEISILLNKATLRTSTSQDRLRIYEQLAESIPHHYPVQLMKAMLHNAFFSMAEFRICNMQELFPLCVLICTSEQADLSDGEGPEPCLVYDLPKIQWQFVDTSGCIAWKSFAILRKKTYGSSFFPIPKFIDWSQWVQENKITRDKFHLLRMETGNKIRSDSPHFGFRKEYPNCTGISLADWAHYNKMPL